MEIEKRDVPTVTLITAAFEMPAALRAAGLGMPGIERVTIPHPLASRKPEELEQQAEAAFASVTRALLIST